MNNLPYAVFTVKDKEYKLKITAKSAVELEKKIGKSITAGIADWEKTDTTLKYLWAGMQGLNAGVREDSVYEIFDDFISAGGTVDNLHTVLLETMMVSGFLKRKQTENLLAQIKELEEKLNSQPQT